MRVVGIVLSHGEVYDWSDVMSLQFFCWADAAVTVISSLFSEAVNANSPKKKDFG